MPTLRRRRSAYHSVSKLATDRTACYFQRSVVESGFRTPTMKALAIQPLLKLSSFDDDRMPTTNTENQKKKNQDHLSGVRVNLNLRFDAVTDTAENERH